MAKADGQTGKAAGRPGGLLPNRPLLDQGGACGAADPASAPGHIDQGAQITADLSVAAQTGTT